VMGGYQEREREERQEKEEEEKERGGSWVRLTSARLT